MVYFIATVIFFSFFLGALEEQGPVWFMSGVILKVLIVANMVFF